VANKPFDEARSLGDASGNIMTKNCGLKGGVAPSVGNGAQAQGPAATLKLATTALVSTPLALARSS
jgi:hypothetical protein